LCVDQTKITAFWNDEDRLFEALAGERVADCPFGRAGAIRALRPYSSRVMLGLWSPEPDGVFAAIVQPRRPCHVHGRKSGITANDSGRFAVQRRFDGVDWDFRTIGPAITNDE
jgi:hypothetical protein